MTFPINHGRAIRAGAYGAMVDAAKQLPGLGLFVTAYEAFGSAVEKQRLEWLFQEILQRLDRLEAAAESVNSAESQLVFSQAIRAARQSETQAQVQELARGVVDNIADRPSQHRFWNEGILIFNRLYKRDGYQRTEDREGYTEIRYEAGKQPERWPCGFIFGVKKANSLIP